MTGGWQAGDPLLSGDGWFQERLHAGVAQAFQVRRTLYHGRSAFQDVAVLDTDAMGRVLVLDGVVQTTERDEFVYHEMLTHLPLFAHGDVRQVLIVGGGDGGILEEVLKHPVERVTMVEIDPAVIEVSRTWLPTICGNAFDDPRAEVIVGDGAAFVAGSQRRFDLIIVDSSDPVGPAEVLFASPFYQACRRCLTAGGILVTQNGVPFLQGAEVSGTWQHLRLLFPHCGFYVAPVPSYYGGFMAFGWGAAANLADSAAAAAERSVRAALPLRYYNADIHRAAFALPGYVRALLQPAEPAQPLPLRQPDGGRPRGRSVGGV